MERRLRDHCLLNGTSFVAAEYGALLVAAAYIGVAFAIHHQPLVVLWAGGVAVNAAVMCGDAAVRRIRGERGASLRSMFRAEYRRKVHEEHPSLTFDTVVLTVAPFIPLLVAAWFIWDLARRVG